MRLPRRGDRIRLRWMADPKPVPPGTTGVVVEVQPQIVRVVWDNGSTLALLPESDSWDAIV